MRAIGILGALLGAAGCDDKGDTGGPLAAPEQADAGACVATDGGLPLADSERNVWDFSGTVVEDAAATEAMDTPLSCGDDVRRILTIEEESGAIWRVGYAIFDEAGGDVTPPIDLAPGDPVSARVRATLSFGDAYGLVVRDGAGALVGAVEVGTWGGALEAADHAEVAVSSGSVTATYEDSCATQEHRALQFLVGDDGGEVAPYGTGTLAAAGQVLTTYAISNWEYLPPVCPDGAGQRLWALFR